MGSASERLRTYLSSQSRSFKRAALVAFDTIALMTVVWLAYCVRFNTIFLPNPTQWLMIVLAPALAIPIFIRMGLYRAVLRYLPDRAVWTIARAVTFAFLTWIFAAFIFSITGIEGVPRSIAVGYWIGSLFVIIISRFSARWFFLGNQSRKGRVVRTVIAGLGDGGTQLLNILSSDPTRRVVAFLNDDRALIGMEIAGVRIYPTTEIATIVSNIGVDEAILVGQHSGAVESRRDLVQYLTSRNIRVRVLPAIGDLAPGRHLISHLRDVQISDLLGRPPVPPDAALLRAAVKGKTVLVTGAAGSIGSALTEVLADLSAERLLLLDTNEHGLFEIHRKTIRLTDVPITPILGSMGNSQLLDELFSRYEVDTVYHCAAYKHVAMAETNMLELVRNNIFGTMALVDAACRGNVGNFVLISSDKAVRPGGVMGATKRWTELIVRHRSQTQQKAPLTRFATVRFGNVLGSSGSVVPLFQEQIKNGGPITLRDSEMTRYFMSVSEAAELIVQAGVLANSGDILVLEMGEPIRIRELAENMIRLAGLSVRGEGDGRGEIDIVVTGPEHGEKIHEELFYDPSGVTPTQDTRILRAKQINGVAADMPKVIEDMKRLIANRDERGARTLLFDLVEGAPRLH